MSLNVISHQFMTHTKHIKIVTENADGVTLIFEIPPLNLSVDGWNDTTHNDYPVEFAPIVDLYKQKWTSKVKNQYKQTAESQIIAKKFPGADVLSDEDINDILSNL